MTAQQDDGLLTRARALHRQVPLIDGHNDYPWALRENNAERDFGKLDIRFRSRRFTQTFRGCAQGGVGGQFWSVYIPATIQGSEAVLATLEQIDVVHRMTRRYPDTFELATTAADVERIFKAGRIASLIGMEGGHSIDNSLAALRMFYAAGARYMTLTHSTNMRWADSGTDKPKSGGLSRFGEEVVREMNRLGMIVDLSHTSSETMEDAIRVSEAPVIFSHSDARALARSRTQRARRRAAAPAEERGHRHGDVRAELPHARREGDVGGRRQSHGSRAEGRRARPRRHRRRLRRHSDCAGRSRRCLEVSGADRRTAPARLAGEDVRKALGLNVLRVMRGVEEVAARLQQQREASTATIEQLDGR